jgi:hypothetical protein
VALQRQYIHFFRKLRLSLNDSFRVNSTRNDYGDKMADDNKRIDTTKEIRQQMIKQLGKKYVEWFDKNMANVKKFWLKEFVYPIVFPMISLGLLRYVFHFPFTRTEAVLMFGMFYLLTITGRLLGKYNKLVEVLDPLIDEVKEMKEKVVKK